MNDKAFEDFIRNRMSAPDEEPDAMTWQNIRQDVDRLQKRKKRRAAFFLLSLFLCTAAGVSLYTMKIKKGEAVVSGNMAASSQNHQQHTPPKEHHKDTVPAMIHSNNTATQDASFRETTRETKHVTPKQTSFGKRSEIPKFRSRKPRSMKHNNPSPVVLDNTIANSDDGNQGIKDSELTPDNIIPEQPLEKFLEMALRPLPYFISPNEPDSFNKIPLLALEIAPDTSKKKNLHPWTIGIEAIAGMGTFNLLPMGEAKLSKAYAQGFGMQFAAARSISERFSIQAGFGSSTWYIRSSSEYNQKYSFVSDSVKVIDRTRNVFFHYLQDSATRMIKENFSERITVLSVPLSMSYMFKSTGKWSPFISIGTVYNRVLSGRLNRNFAMDKPAFVTSYKEASVSRSLWQLSGSVGMAYHLKHNLSMRFSAGYAGQLNSFYIRSAQERRSGILFVHAGLFYHF